MTFNDDLKDEPLDEQLSSLAKSYHEPNAVPREEIWARIEAVRDPEVAAGLSPAGTGLSPARTGLSPAPTPAIPLRPRARMLAAAWRWPIAAAALLVLGIGIGRHTASRSGSGEAIATRDDLVPAGLSAAGTPERATLGGQLTPYQVATASHLVQSESYLTLFRTAATDGNLDSIPVRRARQLLVNNRLLLDSPAAEDPRLRALLQDLELVLMEISQFGSSRRPSDLDLITSGMERGAMITRLRVATPGGARPLPQGIL